ncbi:MAG: MBL fold metallo-hydrolase [Clostridia bacterium]|nr:MBL fold metallo-hydrolase [Clostridia bacterium]
MQFDKKAISEFLESAPSETAESFYKAFKSAEGFIQYAEDHFNMEALGIEKMTDVLPMASEQVLSQSASRENYQKYFCDRLQVVAEMLEISRCGLGVTGHAGYIVKFLNTKIAVDPVFYLLDRETDKEELFKLLCTCDAVITTHDHGDHYEATLVDALSEFMPSFMPDFMGKEKKNTVFVKPGDEIDFKDVKLRFFESEHSSRTELVKEYGFAIEFEGKNYVFPIDVRAYKKPHAVFPNTEAVVLHLWLGRGAALNAHPEEMENFCDFANSFGAKKILISHLLDYKRDIQNMWSEVHFNMVKNKLKNSEVLKLGDWIKL